MEESGVSAADFQYSLKIRQSAKGALHYEFTVRSNDFKELKEMAGKVKKEAEDLCRQPEGEQ